MTQDMYLAVLLATTIVAGPWTWLISAASSECNGRGQRHGNSSDVCVCDVPYAGDECQHCASGYYGVPTGSGGSVCYLSCSSESRLLHNFTSAGLGVPASWLTVAQRPPLSNLPYCLWVVAPLINKLNYSSSQSFESFSPLFYSSISNGVLNFNPPPTDFRISLQFRTDRTSQCYDETVLIYSGLPDFLTPINSSLTPHSPNTTAKDGSLLGAFTGAQLKDHSLSLSSSVLTVVYYSSTTPSSQLQGFNLMVDVEWLSGDNDSYPVNATSEQEAAVTTTCEQTRNSAHNDIISNNQSSIAYLSTLVASPSNTPIHEENNSSMPGTLGHSCPGRHLHTAVYDPSSNSLWIFGGMERSGRLCDSGLAVINLSLALTGSTNESTEAGEGEEREGLVSWIVSSAGDAPRERFSHAAALLHCGGSCNGSRMLVFGGFTSRLVTSRELWLYEGDNEQWTQLESAPVGFGLAGHSATLTPDGRLVVVGGVNSDLHISPTTLLYHLINNTWEVLQIRTLGLPGVYGHSAVYDAATNSVLVYGGYMYTRPQAVLSSSLYSLDMGTLSWRRVQLAHEVPSRMFHSMVVVGNLLVIHGGLLSQQNQPSLEGTCPSNDVTIIDLSVPPTLCSGRPALPLNVSRASSCTHDEDGLWAHSLVTNGEDIFIVGGLMSVLSSSSIKYPLVSLLHLPPSLTCSLAQSTTQCRGIPGCSVCATDGQSDDFIACYNVSDSNATLFCTNSGGVLLIENNSTAVVCPNTPLSCADFESCSACLSTDAALKMGCVWCHCEERCMAAPSPSSSAVNLNCSCPTVNSTQPDICYLDRCSSPSCMDCIAQRNCHWFSQRIRAVPNVPNHFQVFINVPEWGCYSSILQREILNSLERDISVDNCPSPCGTATSCTRCVALSSPAAGVQQTCVWAEYSRECLSNDLVPLACSLGGHCGPILSTVEQCPSPCVSRDTCELCLMDPGCVWLSNVANGAPRCVETRDLKSGVASQTANEVAVYLEVCPNGLTCRQFCHGNSERCIEEDSSNPEFIGWVSGGTSEEGVACEDCGGFSEGRRCESCLRGYFNSNPGGGDVNCRQCACNGHDVDDCDPANGLCSCQNNTRSIPCVRSTDLCLTLSQCSLCLPGYSGDPRDNGQCYRDIPISAAANFSLPANQTTAFSFGPGSEGYFFSNIDVRAAFVVARGLIDVYISTDPTDVTVNLNRATWTHQLSFQPGVNFITRSSPVSVLSDAPARSRSVKSVGESVSASQDDSISVNALTKGEQNSEDGRLVRRALQLSSISPARDSGVYRFVVDEHLSLIVPHRQDGFQSNSFFITVSAREDSQFFFYYRQDQPRLNLFVFFSIFLCLFILVSTVFIYAYQLLLFCLRRRRRQRERQRQKRRANRPMVKVVVYFGDKKQATSRKEKKIRPKQEIFQISEGVSTDTGIFKSMSSKVAKREGNEKPAVATSKADKDVKVVDTNCSCSKAPGEIELETRKTSVPPKDSNEGQKKRKKYQILSTDDIKKWPVGIEPTADDAVCLSTMLIQLPTSFANRSGQLCTGTALLDYPKAALEEHKNRERAGKGKLRFRRKNRLAPTPDNSPSPTTSQV